MSWFDLAGLLFFALAIFDGARSGLAWAVLELFLFLGVAIVTRGFAHDAEPYVGKFADLGPADLVSVSHIVVFVVTAAVVMGALILLHPASRRWRFRGDAWLGGAVGAVNGLFMALYIFALALWAAPRPAYEDVLAESRVRPVLAAVVKGEAGSLFPDYVEERLEQLRKR